MASPGTPKPRALSATPVPTETPVPPSSSVSLAPPTPSAQSTQSTHLNPPHPLGTVTFLFTDIEGSSRLWEQSPDSMRLALRRHDELLREAIEAAGGYVFKTVGDAFCAAFATPSAAVAAAVAGQQAVHEEAWPEPTPIRVRMALHTGVADWRDGDYFGPPLNRCARLLGLAYGGQTLLSHVTRLALADDFPRAAAMPGALPVAIPATVPSSSLRPPTIPPPAIPPTALLLDLGEHRLRDLAQPEHVFQVTVAGLPDHFPPLLSLAALPNNLPVQRTRFIGRAQEIAAVSARLADEHLVTIAGAGGSGKTRLALQTAADLLETYPGGVWLVELADLSDPSGVAHAVARVLGLHEEPGRSIEQTLVAFVESRTMLLILDNCEHLVDAVALLAFHLLSACKGLRILATSREVLNVPGEAVYRIPTLATPSAADLRSGGAPAGAGDQREPADMHRAAHLHRASPEAWARLSQNESVQLFVERAMAAQPGFVLDAGNVLAVAELCRRLDGIAMAIELAAARVPVLAVDEILARLDDRFRLLTGGARTNPHRQQTLRALLDWSYDLLPEPERMLLRRLAVFRGRWTLAAAEAIAAGDGAEAWTTLDDLSRLVDKSLVVSDDTPDGKRYRLLETIREYGWQQLVQADETEAVPARHLAWYRAQAEMAGAGLKGSDQERWLAYLDAERDNVRAALDWAADHGAVEEGLQLAASIWLYWYLRDDYRTGRTILESLLARDGAMESLLARDIALGESLGRDAVLGGLLERDAALKTALDHDPTPARIAIRAATRAMALHGAGTLAGSQGDYPAARKLLGASVAMRRVLVDRPGEAASLNNIAVVARDLGELTEARALFGTSLAIFEALGETRQATYGITNLAVLAEDQGDYEVARSLTETAMHRVDQMGDERWRAQLERHLGNVHQATGDYAGARSCYDRALQVFRRIEALDDEAVTLQYLGELECDLADFAAARTSFDACRALFEEIQDTPALAELWTCTGRLALLEGDLGQAEAMLRESLARRAAVGLRRGVPLTQSWLARVLAIQGAVQAASEMLVASLRSATALGAKPVIFPALETAGYLALASGRADIALQLLSAADAGRQDIGLAVPQPDQTTLAAWLAKATRSLAPSTAKEARDLGRHQAWADAVELACQALAATGGSAAAPETTERPGSSA